MRDINYHLSCARRDELLRVAAKHRRAGEAKAATPAPVRGSRIRRVSRLAVPRWAH
jgi:hypothetical protein